MCQLRRICKCQLTRVYYGGGLYIDTEDVEPLPESRLLPPGAGSFPDVDDEVALGPTYHPP